MANPSRQRTRKSDAKRILRAEAALRCRAQGATYRRIADEMKVSVSTAHELVELGMADARMDVRREAYNLIGLTCRRLDDALRRAYVALTATTTVTESLADGSSATREVPDHKTALHAADMIRKLEMDRARLLGMLAPDEQHHWHHDPADVGEDRLTKLAVRDELMDMPPDQLEREMALFQAGMEAEEQRQADRRKREGRQAP